MEKSRTIPTALTDLLKIEYPIMGAPMFLISDAGLTAAIGQAGGTAVMPALNFRPTENLRAEIQKTKAATNAPFGINIIVQETNKYQEEQIQICIEEGVNYFVTSLGNPKSVIARARAHGIKVFCDVVSEKHAAKVVSAGADGLIAVAAGAGGHAGTLSPFALVPGLKKKFSVPVIAAGSIVDGRTMLAALSLGADGVYVGTRFIASREASAPEEYKRAIVSARATDIVYTERVDGFLGNFIRTPEFDRLVPQASVAEKILRLSPKLNRTWQLLKASKTLFGDAKKMKASYKTIFSAGHGVELIDKLESCDEIIQSMVSEYWRAKGALP